jgi:hypothetical protein
MAIAVDVPHLALFAAQGALADDRQRELFAEDPLQLRRRTDAIGDERRDVRNEVDVRAGIDDEIWGHAATMRVRTSQGCFRFGAEIGQEPAILLAQAPRSP